MTPAEAIDRAADVAEDLALGLAELAGQLTGEPQALCLRLRD